MDKIRDQLSNIERKANEVRANAGTGLAIEDGNVLNSLDTTSLSQPEGSASYLHPESENGEEKALHPPSNSLGLEVGNPNISSQLSLSETGQTQTPVPTPPVQTDSPEALPDSVILNPSQAGSEHGGVPLINDTNSILDFTGLERNSSTGDDNFGETVVGGMKVTLLNLKDHEKEAVEAKVCHLFNL